MKGLISRTVMLTCLLATAMWGAASTVTQAQDGGSGQASTIMRKFTNNEGVAVNDLHVTFNGPVDANSGVSGSSPPFADKTNAGTNTVKFSNGSVAHLGMTGCISFSSTADGLAITSAEWTIDGAGQGELVGSESITPCNTIIPTLSTWGLVVFGLGLMTVMTWFIYRRNQTKAAEA